MPIRSSSSAAYIQSTSPSSNGVPSTRPTSLTIHPSALFSILDHYLRRTDAQHRVIGTLLGTRTDSTVDVKSAFAVLHSETDEQVAVDMDYHRAMYDLCARVRPNETIVGWYSTGSDLNTYSALIQNFYSQETAPNQAVHVALDTGTEEGKGAGVKAYISSPVGIFPKPENCVFVPIPCELRFHEAERSGLDLLLSPNPSSNQTDLDVLASSLTDVQNMLNRVLAYVQSVLRGEAVGDKAVGRYLMDVLGTGVEEDGGWTAGLQDTLMITYLANLVRSQAEVSARLALTTAA